MKLFSFHAGQIARNCRWPKWYKLKLQGLLIHNSSQVTSRRGFLSFLYVTCSINVRPINGLGEGYYSDFLLCSQSTIVRLAYSCQQKVAILKPLPWLAFYSWKLLQVEGLHQSSNHQISYRNKKTPGNNGLEPKLIAMKAIALSIVA